jgi:hypothetical protein
MTLSALRFIPLVLAGLGLGVFAGARVREPAQQVPAQSHEEQRRHELLVPRAATPIAIDGEMDEEAWTRGETARTGGYSVRPYSDARMTWRDGTLYMVLYAADEDLRTTKAHHDEPLWLADSTRVMFTHDGVEDVIEVSPAGVVTDMRKTKGQPFDPHWESGAKVALDLDGTVDDSNDADEEWVVEMAVPLASLGLTGKPGERVGITIQRCDLSKGSPKRTCASWGGDDTDLVLAP